MWVINVRRATEDEYSIISKNKEPLKFLTSELARQYAKENIEGKSMFIVSWFVSELK